jgi:hypothetical protein
MIRSSRRLAGDAARFVKTLFNVRDPFSWRPADAPGRNEARRIRRRQEATGDRLEDWNAYQDQKQPATED